VLVSRRAIAHLKKVDPVLGRIIALVGSYRPTILHDGTHFEALTRAIVYQQLSTRAAATIYGRFKGLYRDRVPTPAELLATSDAVLRGVGLSRQKTRYLKDLAAHDARPDSPLEHLAELDDAAVMEALTEVKGIGRWTAQMFLMFRLARPDVLPALDLGIRKAVQRAYGLRKMPTPEQVTKRGAIWSPFASVAAWYLWRSLELSPSPRSRPHRRRRVVVGAERRRRVA
jgi:DNA-3-methyladenine glycosylase II